MIFQSQNDKNGRNHEKSVIGVALGSFVFLKPHYTDARGQQSAQFYVKLSLSHLPECHTKKVAPPPQCNIFQLQKQLRPCPQGLLFRAKTVKIVSNHETYIFV